MGPRGKRGAFIGLLFGREQWCGFRPCESAGRVSQPNCFEQHLTRRDGPVRLQRKDGEKQRRQLKPGSARRDGATYIVRAAELVAKQFESC